MPTSFESFILDVSVDSYLHFVYKIRPDLLKLSTSQRGVVPASINKLMTIYQADLRNDFIQIIRDKGITRTIIRDFVDSDELMYSFIREFQSIHHASIDDREVMMNPRIFLNWQRKLNSWILNFKDVDKMPELLISSPLDAPPKHKKVLITDHRDKFILENRDIIDGTLIPLKDLELKIDDPYTIINVYISTESLIEEIEATQQVIDIA